MGAFDGHMTLLRIAMAWNDRNGVFAALRKLRAIAVAFDISMLDDYVVDLTEAHVRIAAGNLTAVRQWARRRELAGDLETVMAIPAADATLARLRKYEVVVLARLRLAEGRNADALALLEQLQVVTEHVHRRTLWIEATILCAEAHLAAGAVDRARIEIVHALRAAQPAGFQRIFLDEGEAIRPLLEAARAETRSDQPLSDYIKALLDALPQGPKQILQSADQSEAELIEPLSDRECEVLQLVAEGLANQEIADRLVVSLRTVKFHMSNIFAKLGVSNRTQAVARARELGILM